MEGNDEKTLKILLNSNNVLEIHSVTVPTSGSYSLESFRNELRKQICGLRSKPFALKWKNSQGAEREISDDKDFDEIFPHAKVLYAHLSLTDVSLVKPDVVEDHRQALQCLPVVLSSFSKSRCSGRLIELMAEVVDVLRTDEDYSRAGLQDFLDQSGFPIRKECNDFRIYEGLAQLRQMGFQDDSQALINLLFRYQGNVMAVVNSLRAL